MIALGSVCPSEANAAPAKKGKAPTKKAATSSTSQVVKNIEVIGNKKIEKDAILAKLNSKVGEDYSAARVREDVVSLFGLGYFNDIQVEREVRGGQLTLIYKVLEKPSIAEIVYEGNSDVKADDLAEAIGIKTFQLLNMAKVKEAVEKIQKLYEDKGFFLAKVDVETQAISDEESVRVVFKIQENDKVKVRKITFLGNSKLSDTELKSKMLTQEGGFFSGISGSGQYKQEMFERDVHILRFLYWNQGYVQAKVDRPQITVSPDKKHIYITIRIEEGEQYHVGDVEFAGDILFPTMELREAIKIDDNDIFAYDLLNQDIAALTAKYGDLGYAYTNVIPRTAFNPQERKVNLIFEFDKGSKVYFGKINVVGNTKTRDKVLRREMKIAEGELYNETGRRKSLENIQRLGFFDEVNFKTSVDPERPDVMNVDIMVKERNTGQLQVGAGYGTSTGFTFTGSVNQMNFLGKGQNLGVSLNISEFGSFYNLSFTDPYFNDTLWSFGVDLYQSANNVRLDYNENHTGAAIRLGHPVAEFTRAFLRYKWNNTKLESKNDRNGVPVTDFDIFPLDRASGITSSLTATLEYDTRNDRRMPTKGIFSSASYEYAGLGGDLKYTRGNLAFRFYKNLFWDVVWRNNITYAKIDSLDGEEVPFSELYLLGGPYSMRGYRLFRVGRMKRSQKIYDQLTTGPNPLPPAEAEARSMRFYGGTQQALLQSEIQFPLIKEAGIMGAGFIDVGAADDVINSDTLYSDIGFGIRWYSPIGVLRFEWGFPMKRDQYYHDAAVFEFAIGESF